VNQARQQLERYCRKGDTSAFNAFYSQQADRLWRFLVARGRQKDNAYDVLSESFLKFIQSVCKDPRSPVALLYRIAINLHIDSYRREISSPVTLDNERAEIQDIEYSEVYDERGYVRSLIRKLPKNEQNLFLLRYWIELTHKEISIVMEMTEGTIRRQCAVALKKFKQCWQDESYE